MPENDKRDKVEVRRAVVNEPGSQKFSERGQQMLVAAVVPPRPAEPPPPPPPSGPQPSAGGQQGAE
jgi:hypothetical protein